MDASVYDPWASAIPRVRAAARSEGGTAAVRTFHEVASVVARVYLTIMAGLLFWSLLPLLFGLSPVVVRTGSMQPAIKPGDVILVQHTTAATVRVGQVVLADDPGHPGRLLSHRIVRRNADGTLVTRGDANANPDSTPLQPSQVHGIARLRVPMIGLPALWWWNGEQGKAASWLLLSGAAIFLAGAPVASPGGKRTAARGAGWLPTGSLAVVLAGAATRRSSYEQALTPRPAYRWITPAPAALPLAAG